jgi:hypothetical protein
MASTLMSLRKHKTVEIDNPKGMSSMYSTLACARAQGMCARVHLQMLKRSSVGTLEPIFWCARF